MKRVIKCLGCKGVTRLHHSYAVLLEETDKKPLTGDLVENKIKGRICRNCALEAGYKFKALQVPDTVKVLGGKKSG